MPTPQTLALEKYMAFQNSGGDPWAEAERKQREAAAAQAEIDARRDWVPFSGFDPFTNAWEAKFVPPQHAIDVENLQLQSEHPGARLIDDPFQYGFNRGVRAVAQPKPVAVKAPTSRNVGGNLLERNPITGEWEMKFSPPPKAPAIDAVTKSEIKLLEQSIGKKTSALLKATDDDERNKLALDIQNDRFRLHRLIGRPEAASATQSWIVDPNSIPSGSPNNIQYPENQSAADALSMFGQPGERTPFAFSGGPAPIPMQAPVRRRRYNPQTGRLE